MQTALRTQAPESPVNTAARDDVLMARTLLWVNVATMTRRSRCVPLALGLVARVVAACSLGGCCNDVESTRCFGWSESTVCPDRATAEGKFNDDGLTVTSDSTFWPAHEYEINGMKKTEPAACCYETVSEVCTKELH
jgi:hypothetical protein